jgi:hypothetical protein
MSGEQVRIHRMAEVQAWVRRNVHCATTGSDPAVAADLASLFAAVRMILLPARVQLMLCLAAQAQATGALPGSSQCSRQFAELLLRPRRLQLDLVGFSCLQSCYQPSSNCCWCCCHSVACSCRSHTAAAACQHLTQSPVRARYDRTCKPCCSCCVKAAAAAAAGTHS